MEISYDAYIHRLEKQFLQSRILFFENDFDEGSVSKLKKELIKLNAESRKPILIMISSYGGDAYHLLGLYGVIKSLKALIVTVAIGPCMSAGAYLLLLGDERFALPGSRIMLHEIQGGIVGPLHEQKIDLEESQNMQKILTSIIKEKTTIEKPDEWLRENKYLSPNQAYKLGILTSRKKFLPERIAPEEEE